MKQPIVIALGIAVVLVIVFSLTRRSGSSDTSSPEQVAGAQIPGVAFATVEEDDGGPADGGSADEEQPAAGMAAKPSSAAPAPVHATPHVEGAIEFELARGVRQPIVLSPDNGQDLTEAESRVLAALSDDLVARLEQAARTVCGPVPEQMSLTKDGTVTRVFVGNDQASDGLSAVWRQEQENADSIYRNIFGEAAYQQMSMERALEAMGQTPGNL